MLANAKLRGYTHPPFKNPRHSARHLGNHKFEVCHIPPSDPDNFHTITISENALDAHEAHEDFLGTCNEHCADLCDDGNPCTIDYDSQVGCDINGCFQFPRPAVDCDDGNPNTVNSCDPYNGCISQTICDPDNCDDLAQLTAVILVRAASMKNGTTSVLK